MEDLQAFAPNAISPDLEDVGETQTQTDIHKKELN
jgi:hypothetical protein